MTAHAIYLNNRADAWVLVDAIDYVWCLQWLWNGKPDSGGLLYAKRNQGPARTPVYLHVEICRRAWGDPPAGKPLCDHRNGNTLDARRVNLRWVSHAENNRNRLAGRTTLLALPERDIGEWPGW